jgi:cytochrome c oxidase cbb3-type subunit 4
MELLNDLRVLVTVLSLLSFLGIVFWAYRPKSQPDFERAAQSVLEEEEPGGRK